MATTDSRTGFKLPWSTDPRHQDDDLLVADSTAAAGEGVEADVETPSGAGSEGERLMAAIDQAPSRDEEPSLDAAPDQTPAGASARTSAKKPNKFLADLTRAMQAAAEAAREESIGRFAAEAKTFVEQVHARSAEESTELRRTADEDVSTIRDWSKAEIARIRDETEQRITERKSRLEREVEQHAALIEHEIERIQGRVAEFEAEMAGFFERLLAEDDPSRFAAMAASLPEPPSFDVDVALAEAATLTVPEPEPTAEDESGAEQESGASFNAEAADQPTAEDPEAAFAAIQAAAEAAEAIIASEAEATADAHPATDADGAAAIGAPGSEPGTPTDTTAAEADASTDAQDGSDVDASGAGVDLRLAALGLNPDSAAAAEAEAGDIDPVAAAAEDIPLIADDALAARLAGLVPSAGGEGVAPAVETSSTRVVVVGLVSVASIASFKRHLGRLPGVQSVGVSSGPDGEFVFAVAHGPDLVLGDVIPTLPGFQPRVTASGEGVVTVTAHDPESDV